MYTLQCASYFVFDASEIVFNNWIQRWGIHKGFADSVQGANSQERLLFLASLHCTLDSLTNFSSPWHKTLLYEYCVIMNRQEDDVIINVNGWVPGRKSLNNVEGGITFLWWQWHYKILTTVKTPAPRCTLKYVHPKFKKVEQLTWAPSYVDLISRSAE